MKFTSKIIFFVLFSGLLSIQSYAQRSLKYSRVYETVTEGNREKSYSLLLAYQKQEPEFANTYFQLALIAEYWAKDYDPLTEPALVRFFAYNTKLYYGLANLKLQNESKSNREYYENGGIEPSDKKLSMEDISAFVGRKAKEMETYEKNINEITLYFEKTVDYYNFCVQEYKEINNEYSKIKNIYLSEDAELMNKLNEIQTAFDSSVIYFNKYRKTLDRFPIKSYDQYYKLRPIITYRLDGLTQSNFLKNDISLWDYDAWVKDVKKTLKSDIHDNRTRIESINSLLDGKIKSLNQEIYADNLKPATLDEKFVYKIEKYDPQSLLIAILKYKEALTKYQVGYRETTNKPNPEKNIDLKKHTAYLLNMNDLQKNADSLVELSKNRIAPIHIRKYTNFYLTAFGGLTGLRSYLDKQTQFLENQTKEVEKRYASTLFSDILPALPAGINFTYNGKNIVSGATGNCGDNTYCAKNISQDETGYWISGQEQKAGVSQDFIARADLLGKVTFLKSMSKKTGSSTVFMTKYENEAFCCVRETEDAKQIGMYKVSASGQVSNLQTVKSDLEPVFFDYDGLNNEIILALGTNAAGQNSSRFEIYRFPADSKTIPGPVVLNHEGNIFDILKIDDNIYVFSNYRIYADTDGKTYTAPAHPNLLIDQISPDGKIVRRRIESQRNLVGLKAVKLSSTNIVLSGVFSEFMSDVSNLKAKPLFYIQLDGKMNPVFRNWHD